jgi:hypothetical protein
MNKDASTSGARDTQGLALDKLSGLCLQVIFQGRAYSEKDQCQGLGQLLVLVAHDGGIRSASHVIHEAVSGGLER